MTNNLKCPFCGAELQHWGEDFLYCENLACPMSPQIELPISIWQALIDGKKAQDALKVATQCIKNIGNTWRGNQSWSNDDMDEIRINIENYCDGTLQKIKELKK